MNVINSFDGEYDFLSNFYECPILWKGNLYRNSESIYQSYKTLDNVPFDFTKTTGSQAKKISKKLNVRPDWNKIKFDLMYEICQEKFNQNTDIAQKLMNTGDAILIEGNYWGDTYWGKCNGVGQNNLGKILMKIREELFELQNKLSKPKG